MILNNILELTVGKVPKRKSQNVVTVVQDISVAVYFSLYPDLNDHVIVSAILEAILKQAGQL